MMKKYTTHISLMALVLALVSLGCTLFQNSHKDWDSAMFAVAMLSGLVMVLIGWNIYSLVDVRNLKKELSKTLNKQRQEYVDLSKKINEGTIGVNNSLMISMYMIYDEKNRTGREYCFVNYGIQAIGGYLQKGNIEGSQRVVNNLISRIPELSPIFPEQKIEMLEQLSDIKKMIDAEKIQNLYVLQECILNWNVFSGNLL